MVKSLMATLFSVELSRGSINRLRHQVSEAVAVPVEQAHQYVQGQEVVHSDETGYPQGNGDGKNSKQTKGWLWVLATPLVKVFLVALSRAQATAKALLGEAFKGILISDRYPADNWLDVKQRQICWAHLKRDLTAIALKKTVVDTVGKL
jgi:hypothetical protein